MDINEIKGIVIMVGKILVVAGVSLYLLGYYGLIIGLLCTFFVYNHKGQMDIQKRIDSLVTEKKDEIINTEDDKC